MTVPSQLFLTVSKMNENPNRALAEKRDTKTDHGKKEPAATDVNDDFFCTNIEGIVAAIVFSNPDNGYAIIKLDTEDGFVTVTGTVPGIMAGERYEARGNWVTHPKYGEQFRADYLKLIPPEGEDEIYRYLASGAIKHISEAKARDIVDMFGINSLIVIENEPEQLSAIKGITLKRANKISEDYRSKAGLRRLIDFLDYYKIKTVIAAKLYQDYGDDALDAIRENPYLIAKEVYGAGFEEADSIALDIGFMSDSPKRVCAAVLHNLMHNLSNGHVFIPKGKLIDAASQMIGTSEQAVLAALQALGETGDIVTETIAGQEACYLSSMHEAETYVATRIKEMIRLVKPPKKYQSKGALRKLYAEIADMQGIKYTPCQTRALEHAAISGAMILSGGPGTGKTTIVRGILALFDRLNLDTALCAPTGRAAKRLSETCDRDALTVHRLLGASLSENGDLSFSFGEDNKLDVDAVIVDESSMVDLLLINALLAAMKKNSRIVLVGDADQLHSVGAGNVFSDIIRSKLVPTVILTEIFRQAQDSGIVNFSHSVNNGVFPDLNQSYPDTFFLRRNNDEVIAETVTDLISRRLPQKMGLDPSEIQLLTPTRRGYCGTILLNTRLREALNPAKAQKKEVTFGNSLFRVGDKVMQIKNNYDIIWKSADGKSEGSGVFNGDIGIVTGIDRKDESLTAEFDSRLVTYRFEQLLELEPAFAVTVHKSQGSEYNAVILTLADAPPQLLIRSGLYTAMTRAKSLLVIVGKTEVMAKMINNDRRLKRYSGLRARLCAEASL